MHWIAGSVLLIASLSIHANAFAVPASTQSAVSRCNAKAAPSAGAIRPVGPSTAAAAQTARLQQLVLHASPARVGELADDLKVDDRTKLKADLPGNTASLKAADIAFKHYAAKQTAGQKKQMLLYLPGIEGLGLSAEAAQFADMSENFELYCMQIGSSNRVPFAELVKTIARFIESTAEEPCILCGESFGGVLALSLAYAYPERVATAFVINPATSFLEFSPYPVLGPILVRAPGNLYNVAAILAFVATIPDATQIADVVGILLDPRTRMPLAQRPEALIRRLVSLWSQIGQVSNNLPRETLAFRLQNWLIEGTLWLDPKLKDIKQPVTVLAGTADRLLPSAQEAKRLSGILPDCETVLLQGHGHAAFFDSRVSLNDIIASSSAVTLPNKEQAVVRKSDAHSAPRTADTGADSSVNGSSSSASSINGSSSSSSSSGSTAKANDAAKILSDRDYVDKYEPPAQPIIDLAQAGVDPLVKSFSPIFLSTQPDGTVVRGLSAVPSKQKDRPILLVGNHQRLNIELSIIMERLLAEKSMIPRGLGHPAIFTQQTGIAGSAIKSIFTTFGAVPVSGANMYRLLQRNEPVMIFPGGASESYCNRGEEETLIWPQKAEIVRMAIATNAIIVPFSGIGAKDTFELLLDSREQLQIPILGDLLRRQSDSIPDARKVGNASEGSNELYVNPVVLPKLPARMYFLFHKPIYTEEYDRNDKERVNEVYKELKQEIFQGIQTLQQAREFDLYSDPKRRLPYELMRREQAPTFSTQIFNSIKRRMMK